MILCRKCFYHILKQPHAREFVDQIITYPPPTQIIREKFNFFVQKRKKSKFLFSINYFYLFDKIKYKLHFVTKKKYKLHLIFSLFTFIKIWFKLGHISKFGLNKVCEKLFSLRIKLKFSLMIHFKRVY
jgi:hypothetical protein